MTTRAHIPLLATTPRRLLAPLLVAAFALSGASAAQAATFYVRDLPGPSPADCGTTIATACHKIQDGVAQTASTAGPDRIDVGPGGYPEAVSMSGSDYDGNVIDGTGTSTATGTVIEHPDASANALVRSIGAAPGRENQTFRDLRVRVQGTNDAAINLSGSGHRVENVVVDMASAAYQGEAILLSGPGQMTLDGVTVGGTYDGRAVGTSSSPPSEVIVEDSSLAGTVAMILHHNGGDAVVRRSTLRVPASNGAVIAHDADSLTLESSLVLGGARTIEVEDGDGGPVRVRHSTLDAGTPGPTSSARALYMTDANFTATITDSVVMEEHVVQFGNSVTCSHTDARDQARAADSAFDRGPIACGTGANGNTTSTAAQLFRAPGTDYRLLAGSPAVDSGSPSGLVAGESATDRDGNPRLLDGNRDCGARSDRGAYELTGGSEACPTVAAPGESKPATDSAAPLVSALGMTARRFRVTPRRRSRAAGRAPVGTSFRYRLSEAARVTFAIERRTSGRRVGRRCRKATRKNRGGRRCVRWVRVGSFAQAGAAGANSRKFGGRLGKRPLRRGIHRVVLVARDPSGNRSPARRLPFRIVG